MAFPAMRVVARSFTVNDPFTRARVDLRFPAMEGEGSYKGAKKYDEAAEKFAKSGKVDDAARAAESAFDATEGSGLREAEQIGKSKAKEEDRLLRSKGKSKEDPVKE